MKCHDTSLRKVSFPLLLWVIATTLFCSIQAQHATQAKTSVNIVDNNCSYKLAVNNFQNTVSINEVTGPLDSDAPAECFMAPLYLSNFFLNLSGHNETTPNITGLVKYSDFAEINQTTLQDLNGSSCLKISQDDILYSQEENYICALKFLTIDLHLHIRLDNLSNLFITSNNALVPSYSKSNSHDVVLNTANYDGLPEEVFYLGESCLDYSGYITDLSQPVYLISKSKTKSPYFTYYSELRPKYLVIRQSDVNRTQYMVSTDFAPFNGTLFQEAHMKCVKLPVNFSMIVQNSSYCADHCNVTLLLGDHTTRLRVFHTYGFSTCKNSTECFSNTKYFQIQTQNLTSSSLLIWLIVVPFAWLVLFCALGFLSVKCKQKLALLMRNDEEAEKHGQLHTNETPPDSAHESIQDIPQETV